MSVDIILITYNQERYIRQAVESIFLQQVADDVKVRVIVADDHSTDGTLERIREQVIGDREQGTRKQSGRFEWVFLPEEANMGIAANYKRAIAATTADYVAILEGDDYWEDAYRLQKHIDYLSAHSDCVITKNQYLQYSQRQQEWESLPQEPQIITLREIINHYPLANLSASVYRGDVLRNMDDRVFEFGDRQRHEATDWYMTLEVMKHGYMYIFDEVMSIYRVDTGSNISREEKSYDEEKEKAKLCYEQTLALLGNDYQAECRQIEKRTENFIARDKQNRNIQCWSQCLPPFVVRWACVGIPALVYSVKHSIRECVPNGIYKKIKR